MKIVVIGGSGLIGSRTVTLLRQTGHEVLAASPSTGVNTLTGEGLSEALAGAEVVVDVANSPSFEPQAVLAFFETSGRNLLSAEHAAGIRHHVALSIVGTDRMPDNGYFQAKVAQEKLIEGAATPYSIVRATQFMEFLGAIADGSVVDGSVRLPAGLFQPIAADDVARSWRKRRPMLREAVISTSPVLTGRPSIGSSRAISRRSAIAEASWATRKRDISAARSWRRRWCRSGRQDSVASPSTIGCAVGAVKSQINGGPVRTFKAGESFTELPGDHHGVSANASDTQPSKLLAVFVVNTNEKVLTIPDPK